MDQEGSIDLTKVIRKEIFSRKLLKHNLSHYIKCSFAEWSLENLNDIFFGSYHSPSQSEAHQISSSISSLYKHNFYVKNTIYSIYANWVRKPSLQLHSSLIKFLIFFSIHFSKILDAVVTILTGLHFLTKLMKCRLM